MLFDCQRSDGKGGLDWRGGMLGVEYEHWRRREIEGKDNGTSLIEGVCGEARARGGGRGAAVSSPLHCEVSAEKVWTMASVWDECMDWYLLLIPRSIMFGGTPLI